MINTTDNIILDKTGINKLLELKTVEIGRTMKLLHCIRDTSQVLTDNNNKYYHSDTLCQYMEMETSQFYKFTKELRELNIVYYGPYKGTYNKVYVFNPLIARKYEDKINSYALTLFKTPLGDLISKLV